MIKSVIRCPNNMVLVFNEHEEQIPEYQGQYEETRERILEDASSEAVFSYLLYYKAELKAVTREEW